MEYYKSERDMDKGPAKRGRNWKKAAVLTAAGLAAAVVLIFIVRLALSPESGLLSFFSLKPPALKFIEMEMNGKEMRLAPGDTLEISYRDEFVIKKIKTDSLFGMNLSADVEGLGGGDDVGVLLKGVELVDKVIAERGSGAAAASYAVKVKRGEDLIAEIPINVAITPQDWLRLAKGSGEGKSQVEYLKKALDSNRNDVATRKMLAASYAQQGKASDAAAEYAAILKIKPDDLPSLIELSKIYLERKDYAQALPVCKRIVELSPRDASARANLALSYEKTGSTQAAAASYAESLKLAPSSAVRLHLAGLYERMGKPAEAIAQYKEAYREKPSDIGTLTALADACLKAGRYDEAIKYYRELTRISPKNAAAHANLGFAYGKKGMGSEEAASYRKAVSLNPKDPVIHYNLALVHEKNKNYRGAASELERALKLKPTDGESLAKLAEIYTREKRFKEAVSIYQRAVKASPNNPSLHAGMGYALGQAGRLREAAAAYEKALRAGSRDPQVYYNLGYTYEKLGDSRRAAAGYEKYAAMQPNPQVLTFLAEYYIKNKNYNGALGAYKKLLKTNAKKSGTYSGMAHVHGLMGDIDGEIENYKTAIRYDKDDEVAHYQLGAAYEKKGMLADALREYTTAYELNPESRAGRKIPQIKIKLLQQKHKQ